MSYGYASIKDMPPWIKQRYKDIKRTVKTRCILQAIQYIQTEETKPSARRKCASCGYAWLWHHTLKTGWLLKRGIVRCKKFKEAKP